MSAMEEYWTYNAGSVSDPGIIWDAFKAVLRGRLIQYCSIQKRKETEKLLNLEQQLKHLKLQYIQIPDQITWSYMNTVKY